MTAVIRLPRIHSVREQDVQLFEEGRIAVEKRPDRAGYIATMDGAPIGYVHQHQTESWRKSGRIRTGLIGRPKHWEAETMEGHGVGHQYARRFNAIAALVRDTRLMDAS